MDAPTTRPAWLEAAAARAAAERPMRQTIVPAPVAGRVVHIDGDYAAYRCAGGGACRPDIARQNVRDTVRALTQMSGAVFAVVHLTMPGGTKGERYLIATARPYQAQRSGQKPANWEMLRRWLEEYDGYLFTVRRWHDREADDGMALASWQAPDPLQTCAIASPDKDMRMLAGLHIDWHDYTLTEVPKGAFAVLGQSDDTSSGKVYGHKWFWLQMLQGDTADNIPGLPRADGKLCGEKTAQKYLKDAQTNGYAYDIVARLYREHYGADWYDAFVEQAALLWLRGSKAAHIHDFLRIVPRSSGMEDATRRLINRVKEERAEIDRIHAAAREGQTQESAA